MVTALLMQQILNSGIISAKSIMHLPAEIWTGILSSNEYVFDSSSSSENRYTSTMLSSGETSHTSRTPVFLYLKSFRWRSLKAVDLERTSMISSGGIVARAAKACEGSSQKTITSGCTTVYASSRTSKGAPCTLQGIPCASIHSKKALHSINVIC